MTRRLAVAVLGAAVAAACGCEGGGDPMCGSGSGSGVHLDPSAPPCERLSSYRFFAGVGDDGRPELNDGVIPYDVNTPLFSDYTVKLRAIYMPEGAEAAPWPEGSEPQIDDAFAFPVGTVLIKTFAVADELGDPPGRVRLIETRLLVHRADGWEGHPYIWNDAQDEAIYEPIGEDRVRLEWTHTDGAARSTDEYLIPSERDCRQCHASTSGEVSLLGLRLPQVAKDYAYPDGAERNQLEVWADAGLIAAEPSGVRDEVPVYPRWHTDGTPERSADELEGLQLDHQARAYLDANCANCHNPTGNNEGAGLDLRYHVTDPTKLGVCKRPFAAGSEAQGGRTYDVVPGAPDDSVLIYRISSSADEPGHANRRMPPKGRSVRHDEGVALMRAWIAWLDDEQALERYPALAEHSCE